MKNKIANGVFLSSILYLCRLSLPNIVNDARNTRYQVEKDLEQMRTIASASYQNRTSSRITTGDQDAIEDSDSLLANLENDEFKICIQAISDLSCIYARINEPKYIQEMRTIEATLNEPGLVLRKLSRASMQEGRLIVAFHFCSLMTCGFYRAKILKTLSEDIAEVRGNF